MEYTKDRKLTFEQQQELNYIRNSAIGTACEGLTTAELNKLNPDLLRAAPEMYEALKALEQSPKSKITDCPADISSAPCVCGWHDAIDNAMKALSKAEGK